MENKTRDIAVRGAQEVEVVSDGDKRLAAQEPSKTFDNKFDMAEMLKTAGQLKITPEQKSLLQAPLKPEEIEIRPDGLIYLPWVEYQSRLDAAFGTEWSMVPNGMPMFDKNTGQIIWGFYLVIQGRLVDFAVGGQEYTGTRGLNYTDAVEGCKSNALMRLCKRLSIGLDMWRPSFVREWKEKYAESYRTTDWGGRPKTMWRRKTVKTETKKEEK